MAARMQAATRLIAEIRACAFSRLIYGWLTEGFDNARSQRSKGAARHKKPPSACADLAFSGVVRGDARCDASGSPWRCVPGTAEVARGVCRIDSVGADLYKGFGIRRAKS